MVETGGTFRFGCLSKQSHQGEINVTGHEFTHTVQRKEKNNSLLPQARRAAPRSAKTGLAR